MANISVGIVGLPNVGKSTLFNALTKQEVSAENYPFCTIDPNVGIVAVPDERLDKLEQLVKPKREVPAIVEFVDIAGLVSGASKGEGLGNQFLSHIREVDVIAEVLRFFESGKIAHVEDSVDPKRDREIVEMELMLKDLDTVEKRKEKIAKEARVASKESAIHNEQKFLERIYEKLQSAELIKDFSTMNFSEDERKWLKDLSLLSTKKIIYVANIGTKEAKEYGDIIQLRTYLAKKAQIEDENSIIPVNIEEEFGIMSLSESERQEYLGTENFSQNGVSMLIQKAYDLLGLQSFFTAGEDEVRAWTIKKGSNSLDASAVIHTDFAKRFINLEVVSYEDFIANGSWQKAREEGKVRLEGRDYKLVDGDVIIVKHNA